MLISLAGDSPTGDVTTSQLVSPSVHASHESTALRLEPYSHLVNAGRQQTKLHAVNPKSSTWY